VAGRIRVVCRRKAHVAVRWVGPPTRPYVLTRRPRTQLVDPPCRSSFPVGSATPERQGVTSPRAGGERHHVPPASKRAVGVARRAGFAQLVRPVSNDAEGLEGRPFFQEVPWRRFLAAAKPTPRRPAAEILVDNLRTIERRALEGELLLRSPRHRTAARDLRIY